MVFVPQFLGVVPVVPLPFMAMNMAEINGGEALTTYKSWDDPPKKPSIFKIQVLQPVGTPDKIEDGKVNTIYIKYHISIIVGAGG